MKKLICLIITIFICSITINVKAEQIVLGINENGQVTLMGNPALANRYTYEDGVLTLTTIANDDQFVIANSNYDFTLKSTNEVNVIYASVSKSITINSQNPIKFTQAISGNGTGKVNVIDSPDVLIFYPNNLKELNIKNSKLTANTSTVDNFVVDNSEITFTGADQYIASMDIKDSTITGEVMIDFEKSTSAYYDPDTSYIVKNSTIDGGSLLNFRTADTTIENCTITAENIKLPYEGTSIVKNSTINFYSNFLANSDTLLIENTKILNGTVFEFEQNNNNTILIKDSEIDVGQINGGGNVDGNRKLINSKVKTVTPAEIVFNEVNNSYMNIGRGILRIKKVIDSELDLGLNSFYVYDVTNSKINMKDAYSVTFNSSNIVNSIIEQKNSIENSGKMKGTINKLEKSEILTENVVDYAMDLELLSFINSHIIAKGNKAFILKNDIADLGQIEKLDENGNNLGYEDIDDNGTIRKAFIKNNEESDYVEIRSIVYVTAKVANGTWEDGTTDDKVIKTYAGINLSDIIPTGMIANDGYKSGSWNVEVNGNKIFDNVEITYSFVKDSESDDVEEAKEEDVVNPKTADSLSTIKIIALFVSIIGLIGRLYISHKKRIG